MLCTYELVGEVAWQQKDNTHSLRLCRTTVRVMIPLPKTMAVAQRNPRSITLAVAESAMVGMLAAG